MRLLRLDPGGVQKLLDEMEKDCSDIKKNALSLAWYMRGGISYEDALNMSMDERSHSYHSSNRNMSFILPGFI
jgi:hypothetical protein